MANNEFWGIDIGKTGVKAIKIAKGKDQLEITAIDIVEYEQSSSESEDVDREEQVRQALSEFQARNKISKKDRIFVSIPGQATFNRLITIPAVEKKRIGEIVTYEAQQQIPFPIDEVIWDYQLIGDGQSLEEHEVMLFAVRKEIINNFIGNLESAGITPSGIQIAPLAIYNFVKFERPNMEAGVAIDIGAENTDLVVLDSDKLWLRALPSAGDDITKALQSRFNVPYQEAEKLKLKSGKSKQAKKIFEVMKPVLKDLVGEIHRSVGYYKSMAKDIKFEKMIFMGNATKLSGFEKFFSQNLQYDIEVLSEVKQMRISPKVNVNQFQTNITTFAVAMGLALQGLGKAAIDIRLLPKEMKDKIAGEKAKPVLIIAVALLAIVPIYKYITYSSFHKEIAKLHDKIGPRIKKLQGDYNNYTAAQNYGSAPQELKMLQSIGIDRVIWTKVFNEINKTYIKASEDIAKKDKPKIWWRNFRANQQGTGKDAYLQCTWEIAFEGLKRGEGDQLENLNYLKSYLIHPLEKTGFFKEENIKEEYRKYLVEPKEGEDPFGNDSLPYYFATITFKAYLNPPKKKTK